MPLNEIALILEYYLGNKKPRALEMFLQDVMPWVKWRQVRFSNELGAHPGEGFLPSFWVLANYNSRA